MFHLLSWTWSNAPPASALSLRDGSFINKFGSLLEAKVDQWRPTTTPGKACLYLAISNPEPPVLSSFHRPNPPRYHPKSSA